MSDFFGAFVLLACVAFFGFVFWRQHVCGHASLNWAIWARKTDNPTGFWLLQAITAAAAIVALVGALAILWG